MKRRQEGEPVKDVRVLSEFEFTQAIKANMEEQIEQLNGMQSILTEISEYKKHGYRIEFSLVDGLFTYKPTKKPEMGFKTKHK